MRKIIDNRNAARNSPYFLTSPYAFEMPQRFNHDPPVHTQNIKNSYHGQGVESVMPAGQHPAKSLKDNATLACRKNRPSGLNLQVSQTPVCLFRYTIADNFAGSPGNKLANHRIVDTCHQKTIGRHDGNQLSERSLHAIKIFVNIGMIKFNTGQNNNPWTIMEKFRALIKKGCIILITLGNKIIPTIHVVISTKRLHQPTDHETGRKARPVQHAGKDGRSGGLAMGSGYHQRLLAAYKKMGKSLRKGHVGNSELAKGDSLRILAANNIADHDKVGTGRKIFRRITGLNDNFLRGQKITHGRINLRVRSSYEKAGTFQHTRQGAYTGPADTHKMNAANGFRKKIKGSVEGHVGKCLALRLDGVAHRMIDGPEGFIKIPRSQAANLNKLNDNLLGNLQDGIIADLLHIRFGCFSWCSHR